MGGDELRDLKRWIQDLSARRAFVREDGLDLVVLSDPQGREIVREDRGREAFRSGRHYGLTPTASRPTDPKGPRTMATTPEVPPSVQARLRAPKSALKPQRPPLPRTSTGPSRPPPNRYYSNISTILRN
jgi:hypothetical protein